MKTWNEFIKLEQEKDYFKLLTKNVNNLYKTKTIYPKYEDIYKAFELTSYLNTKVVIIGQDPYHNVNQAMGLSFSVNNEKLPPSLRNIYKELYDDLGIKKEGGDLTSWAKQGVLLLNRVLTVEAHTPNSHKKLGWETFTNNVITYLNNKETPVVFVLWGNNAMEVEHLITNDKHLILTSSHPSPFSARKSFFGSKVFSNINKFLIKTNQEEINW